MAAPAEKSELYEIMPVESYSDVGFKSEHLEKEIEEIKASLKSTVGLAKVESNAQAIITQMLDMIKTSQKLVDQVATANQQLAAKVQEALDRMNETNMALSEKLGTILDSFAGASEEGGEAPEEGHQIMKDLHDSIRELVEQNSKILHSLESIERNFKRTAVMGPVAPRPMPAYPRRMPMAPRPQAALQPGEVPPGFEESLPPPPFPP